MALKHEAGIGGRRRKDISFDKAAEEFLKWAEANHRPKSVQNYRWNLGSGKPFRSIRTQFTTACRNAKLADVIPHTLRHTFASRLAIAGVGLRTIQELGGWKEIRMVQRYAHLSDQHKADAVERITGKIAENSPTVITTAKSQSAKSLCARSSGG